MYGNFVSSCCGAPFAVAGKVTHYFLCQQCGTPCDTTSTEAFAASRRSVHHQRLINIFSGMVELGFPSHPSYDMDPLIEGVSHRFYEDGNCIITCPIETFEQLVSLALSRSDLPPTPPPSLLSLAKRESS
jgi:hypothetical protein